MKNINVGIISLIVSENFKNEYFGTNILSESKISINNFFETIKTSPILRTEFKIFSNIENKHIDNDVTATRYIDNNIRLLEVYTLEEVLEEREKLKMFLKEDFNGENYGEKIKLYECIDNLLLESLKVHEDIDVDKLHESFDYVLNHIKRPIEKREDNVDVVNFENINENIIKIAIDKFNNKYKNLLEEDKKFLTSLIKSSESKKRGLFEEHKNDALFIVENTEYEGTINKKTMVIEKIRGMNYNKDTVNDDIIKLYELKKGLI